MSQVSQLSPELARGVLQLAQALLAAARTWTLYPPEHPAVAQSAKRLCDAVPQTSSGGIGAGETRRRLAMRDRGGEDLRAVVEAVDPEPLGIDPCNISDG